MKKLAPGVYADDIGGLHIEVPELLRANGWAPTPENIEMATEQARRTCADLGIELVEED